MQTESCNESPPCLFLARVAVHGGTTVSRVAQSVVLCNVLIRRHPSALGLAGLLQSTLAPYLLPHEARQPKLAQLKDAKPERGFVAPINWHSTVWGLVIGSGIFTHRQVADNMTPRQGSSLPGHGDAPRTPSFQPRNYAPAAQRCSHFIGGLVDSVQRVGQPPKS